MDQYLTTNEIEQAKEIAAQIWPDVNMTAVTIHIMPLPQPETYKWADDEGVTSDTMGILFSQGYSFAFHPLLHRLWIGKEENHNVIPTFWRGQ